MRILRTLVTFATLAVGMLVAGCILVTALLGYFIRRLLGHRTVMPRFPRTTMRANSRTRATTRAGDDVIDIVATPVKD